MARRVFISFDYDHDVALRDFLVGQAKLAGSPFEIADWSVKEPFTGDWKAKVRTRIRSVDQVAVMCGHNTDTAAGVSAELEIARDERKPYFLLKGYRQDLQLDMGEPEDVDRGRAVSPVATPEEPLPEGYLDIYKLAVASAEGISSQRAVASSYFLTALSALLVVIGLTTKHTWAFALPGLILSLAWWLLLRSYRLLNQAKFKVIHQMEERLPAQPFTDEWPITETIADTDEAEAVRFRKIKQLRGRYAELGVLEQTVPLVFAVTFLVILIASWT